MAQPECLVGGTVSPSHLKLSTAAARIAVPASHHRRRMTTFGVSGRPTRGTGGGAVALSPRLAGRPGAQRALSAPPRARQARGTHVHYRGRLLGRPVGRRLPRGPAQGRQRDPAPRRHITARAAVRAPALRQRPAPGPRSPGRPGVTHRHRRGGGAPGWDDLSVCARGTPRDWGSESPGTPPPQPLLPRARAGLAAWEPRRGFPGALAAGAATSRRGPGPPRRWFRGRIWVAGGGRVPSRVRRSRVCTPPPGQQAWRARCCSLGAGRTRGKAGRRAGARAPRPGGSPLCPAGGRAWQAAEGGFRI